MTKPKTPMPLLPMERITQSILQIRGMKVMLDSDLATLYGVETRSLIQAVKRNESRFPDDFMFQMTDEEHAILRSQTVISSEHGGRRFAPYVFTEQGVAMLSSVLRSEQAVLVNVAIMRAFVQLRGLAASHQELARRLDELEKRTDGQYRAIFRAIEELMENSHTHEGGVNIAIKKKD